MPTQPDQIIANPADLFRYFDAVDQKAAERTLYKQTSCGAWLVVGADRVAIGSIVEGHDGNAIEADPLIFPFTYSDLEHAIAWVEDRAEELYEEVNGGESLDITQW